MCPRRPLFSKHEEGNVLIVAVLLIALMGALVSAQVLVEHKGQRQASSVLARSDLYTYAESGIALALHDLRYAVTEDEGKIGTAEWTVADDYGRDGQPATGDEGEGDGIPTPGEPNVYPVAIGPQGSNTTLITHVFDTGLTGIQRIVATSTRGNEMVTAEHYVEKTVITIPKVAAVYVDPNVAFDLKGNSFLIDGHDTNPDGTPGPGPDLYGIATAEGANPGDNQANLIGQIPSKNYDQVLGIGGSLSVGEVQSTDLKTIFSELKGARTENVAPGTYSDVEFGNAASGSFPVTYVSGDLHLSGQGSGAGILLVEGSLTMSGQFEFQGLVIVLGDVRLTGGGSGVHIYGGLMVGESLTAIDQTEDTEVTVSGNAEIRYSSTALANVEDAISGRAQYTGVLYEEK